MLVDLIQEFTTCFLKLQDQAESFLHICHKPLQNGSTIA